MSLFDALILFSVMAALALLPSTSVALVVARSSTAGFSNGAAAAGGIVVGDLIFVCLAILGMAAVAELMGGFFIIVRYLAGAYLIWVGVSLLRSRQPSPSASIGRSSPSLLVSFFSGLIVTLGDVKAIFFYASLFPAFVDLATISGADVAFIVILTLFSVGGVKLGYAYAGGKMATLAGRLGVSRGAKAGAGGLMVGAGAYLIIGAKA
jgi:threonine/homoserine/homoserine lactone efflux protein